MHPQYPLCSAKGRFQSCDVGIEIWIVVAEILDRGGNVLDGAAMQSSFDAYLLGSEPARCVNEIEPQREHALISVLAGRTSALPFPGIEHPFDVRFRYIVKVGNNRQTDLPSLRKIAFWHPWK
jgi:hypothetical protein